MELVGSMDFIVVNKMGEDRNILSSFSYIGKGGQVDGKFYFAVVPI